MAPPLYAPFAADNVKRRRGAKVDNDCRTPVAVERGHAVDDAVGAQLPGLVDVEIESDIQISGDDHRIDTKPIAGHLDQPCRHARHDAGDDHAVDLGQFVAVGGKERGQHRKPLVRHTLALGRQPVCGRQLTSRGEESERGVRVANFHGKEHDDPLATFASALVTQTSNRRSSSS